MNLYNEEMIINYILKNLLDIIKQEEENKLETTRNNALSKCTDLENEYNKTNKQLKNTDHENNTLEIRNVRKYMTAHHKKKSKNGMKCSIT